MLHEETGDQAFAIARRACGHLGLRLKNIDATTRGYFERYVGDSPIDRTYEELVRVIRAAVIAAADHVDPKNDPAYFDELLNEPDRYKYSNLLQIMADTKRD
jgi:hypothetical protein